MKYAKGSIGRVLVVKFDHGDDLIEGIKEIVVKENISFGIVTFLGALSQGDIVAGPKKLELPAEGVFLSFDDGREVLGTGTITNNAASVKPHIHVALGKGKNPLVGCLRKQGKVFITVEAVITELDGIRAARKKDDITGHATLSFN